MTDLLLTAGGDLALEGGDLVLDTGLGSAVLRSLLTDRRATLDELERVDGDDPRGWWGSDAGFEYGSGLWLLEREKATAETRLRAEEYSREALAWMTSMGIASSVTATASYPRPGVLHVAITVTRGDSARWAHLWERPQPALHQSERLTIAVLMGAAS